MQPYKKDVPLFPLGLVHTTCDGTALGGYISAVSPHGQGKIANVLVLHHCIELQM